MLQNNTFPNAYINLQDDSVVTIPDPTILPLHLPLFLTFAETGPIGIPVIGGTNTLTETFGSNFLNERSIYYQHPNVFLARALKYQQVYMVRVADPAATPASLVLMCAVTPANIVQYKRTAGGSIIYNSAGVPEPQLQADNVTIVTQPGVQLTYSIRQLASNETISSITTTTVVNGSVTTTNYPIMAFTTYAGSAGNNVGFRLFYNSSFDANAVSDLNALLYNFQPVKLNTNTNIESPIYDLYNSQTQTFSFLPQAYDPATATYYNLDEQIANNFNTITPPPFQFYVYNSNVGLIGSAVLAVSPELAGIGNYMINIFSGVDSNNNPYEHMTLAGNTSSIFNSNVVNYLSGGTDGLMTKSMLENQTVAFLTGETNPALGDAFRYPITHFYDSGYSLPVKQQLMGLFALRDDVHIDFSTQDVALQSNTESMDQSAGSALRTAALLMPESTDFGTQTCRVDIYPQCATLSDTNIYKNIVPATLWRMITRCMYNGTDRITGEPKGRPNSEVSIFNIKSINWTPTTPQQKQLSYNTGINYMQYCDISTLFYPDLLSVYPIDSSLLSSSVFADYVAVYLKKIIRRQWTIIVGRDDPPATLFTTIAKAIDAAASYAFNGKISTTTVVSQTAIDTALGYQMTVTTTVKGNPTNRVWKVIVPITRA